MALKVVCVFSRSTQSSKRNHAGKLAIAAWDGGLRFWLRGCWVCILPLVVDTLPARADGDSDVRVCYAITQCAARTYEHCSDRVSLAANWRLIVIAKAD